MNHFAIFILNKEKGSVNQLLKKLETLSELPPDTKTALSLLFAFTVSKKGLHHPLVDKDNVDYNDAKFMINVCSAFINFADSKISLTK